MKSKRSSQTVLSLTDGDRRLVLSVLGRQYPDAEPDDRDDWLLVMLEITRGGRTWRKTDPALTTQDLKKLRRWILRLSRVGTPFKPRLGFIEPLLLFKVLEYSRAEIRIRVRVDYYDEYKDVPAEWYTDEKFIVDFSLDMASLPDAIRTNGEW